jgi:hypothetical protein
MPHHDVAQPPLQIRVVRRQTQNCHNLARHRDVEAILSWVTVPRTAQSRRNVTQRTVVHVEDLGEICTNIVELGDVQNVALRIISRYYINISPNPYWR